MTLGTGAHQVHTVEEFAAFGEYLDACRLALELARAADRGRRRGWTPGWKLAPI